MKWLDLNKSRALICGAMLTFLATLLDSGIIENNVRAQSFLLGFEDVPLMTELTIIEGSGIHFDTPSGRIAETYATGYLQSKDVLEFYRTTLHQLGWTESKISTFEREGETLNLLFRKLKTELIVCFRLSPNTAADSQ